MDDYPDNNPYSGGSPSPPPPLGGMEAERSGQYSSPQYYGQDYSQQRQYSSPQYGQDYSQQGGKPKSHVAAIVLAVLLGGWGAERFYLGYIWSAILKASLALFVIVFTVVALVAGAVATDDGSIQYYRSGGYTYSYGYSSGSSDELAGFLALACGGVAILLWFGGFVWWVVDLVRVCTKKLEPKDGYYT